jgi:hypothetical protein
MAPKKSYIFLKNNRQKICIIQKFYVPLHHQNKTSINPLKFTIMKKVLFVLVILFSALQVAEAKPRVYSSYSQYSKNKRKVRKNRRYKKMYVATPYKHKKCSLAKVYPVR